MPQRHRNKPVFLPEDQLAYLQYYQAQAGAGGIPVFRGSQAQYGYGLGGILRGLIRRIIPFGAKVIKAIQPVARQAFEIAKPHLKEAASDIAHTGLRQINETVRNLVGPARKHEAEVQAGSGRTRKRKAKRQVKKRRVMKKKRINDIYSGGIYN